MDSAGRPTIITALLVLPVHAGSNPAIPFILRGHRERNLDDFDGLNSGFDSRDPKVRFHRVSAQYNRPSRDSRLGFRKSMNEAPQTSCCNCGCGSQSKGRSLCLAARKDGQFKGKGEISPFLGVKLNMSESMEEIKVVPPSPGTCPVCATKHDPKEPHDRDSLYYQNSFRKRHRRFPTWADAMAHCEEGVKADFKKRLEYRGIFLDETINKAQS